MQARRFWFLTNVYGWLIVGLSAVTAIVVGEPWVLALGVIGYQAVLLVELTWGRSLGRTGSLRLARAEQENRELRAEQARLLGAIRELEGRLRSAGVKSPDEEAAEEGSTPEGSTQA
jgi:hypothetical protein